MNIKKITPLLFILISCILLFRITWNASYVGWFEDDAHYIILAKALLDGKGYVNLDNPGATLHKRWPPGFPILLIPFVAILGNNYALLKWINVLFTSLSLVLCHQLFYKKLPRFMLWSLIIFIATNNLTLLYSTTVMSDPVFMFLSLLFMLTLSNYGDYKTNKTRIWNLIIIGIILMVNISIRITGFVLFIPLFFSGILHKDAKLIILGSLPSIIILLVAPFSYHWSQWSGAFPVSNPITFSFDTLLSNIWYYFQVIVVNFSGTVDKQLPNNLMVTLPWCFLLLLVLGFVVHIKEHKDTWITYLLFYSASIVLWWSSDVRLILPLIPFLYYFLLQGLTIFLKFKNGIICKVIIGILFISNIFSAVRFFSYWVYPSHIMNSPNWTLFTWLQKNTTSEDHILSTAPGRTYLFTNRKSLSFGKFLHRFQMLGYIFNTNVTYIYFSPDTSNMTSEYGGKEALVSEHYWRMIQEDPYHFQLAFNDPIWQTYVYKVLPRKNEFKKAVDLIDEAIVLREGKRYKEAIDTLNQAIALEPNFYLAMNLLGLIFVEEGNPEKGISIIQNSIKLYPTLTNSYLDLATAYEKAGYHLKAKLILYKALALAQQQRHLDLIQQIQQEIRNIAVNNK